MSVYTVLNKRKLLIFISFLALLLLLFCESYTVYAGQRPNAQSNADRVDYIYSLGFSVNETPRAVENITIPISFSDVYKSYNELQLLAGFDLREFQGKNVTKYSYILQADETVLVNLLVYKGRIVGGDICCIRLDGFMKPLVKQENKEHYGTNSFG